MPGQSARVNDSVVLMSTVSQSVRAMRKLTPSMMWLLRFQKMPRLRLARTLMKSSVKPTSAMAATPPRITNA